MARRRREHQPGCGAAVLAPAGAEHQWQLGESGATRSNAGARRHKRHEPTGAARRDERRSRCPHRSHAGLAALLDRIVRSSAAGTVMKARRAPDSGNRAAITFCVILATLMQALDT